MFLGKKDACRRRYLRSSSSFRTFPSYTAVPRPSTAVMAETASTAALPAVSCRESWPCLGIGRGTRFTVWFGGYQTYLWWDTNRWYVMSRPLRTAPQGAAC